MIDLQKHWGEREIYYQAELASKIIKYMQDNGKVDLISKESRSCTHSGLYAFLDELCKFWGWKPSDINIYTTSILEKSDQYTIKKTPSFYSARYTPLQHKEYIPWDGSKTYGMFLGRATAARIRGVVRHRQFEFRDQGLTSFHHDIEKHVDTPELLEYLCESNDCYRDLLAIRPYSDIDKVYQSFIVGQELWHSNWDNVYKKIALELVFETSTFCDNVLFSEKMLRTILYKRPFMLIAGKHSVKYWSDPEILRNGFKEVSELSNPKLVNDLVTQWSGLKFFENVFGTEYDNDEGIYRVDHVYDILHTLIRKGKIEKLQEACKKDIEHNYNTMIKTLPLMKEIARLNDKNLDRSAWHK
jgi:hypothetical protein